MNTATEFSAFELNYVPNISLNQVYPKCVFFVENGRSEHPHWILNIRINLDTKFELKLKIWIFWIKFSQKEYSRSKTKKVNITIEFCMLKLVQVLNFGVNWQFQFFGPNLQNTKSEHHHWILQIRISLGNKPHFKQTIRKLGTKFAPKNLLNIELGIFELV